MATAESSVRSDPRLSAGRANGSIARRPPGRPRVVPTRTRRRDGRVARRTRPPANPDPPNRTHPDVPTRDPTGPHGTWGPRATGPSHRGHPPIPNLPWPHHPNTTRTAPECADRMTFPARSLVGRPARVARELGSSPRRTALAIALLFGVQLGVHARRAVGDVRAGTTNSFSSSSEAALVVADQPQPRQRRAQGAQGRLAR